jgi:hypothetical protein
LILKCLVGVHKKTILSGKSWQRVQRTAVHCSEALFFGVYVAFRAIGSAAKIVDDPVTKPKHCRTL